MSDTPVVAPPSVVTQAEAVAAAVKAELAKANAARSAAFHTLIAEFGMRAVYIGFGVVGSEIVRVLFTHSF